MSNNPGKGSILFKLIIVVLAVLMILVIKIPDNIWDQESSEKKQSHFNISSIYEAQKHYHRLTNNYTTDIDALLREIRGDSSIAQTQQLVSYTQKMRSAIDNYLDIDLINSLMVIDQNISSIIEDLTTNDRYFRIDENVRNEAEQVKISLSIFSGDVKFPNYYAAVTNIDSVNQLKRDLSDYNLQTAASMAVSLSEKINSFLPGVEIDNINSEWKNISSRLENFRIMANEPNISQNTSVAARIKEFASKADAKFNALSTTAVSANVSSAQDEHANFQAIYQTFLQDFIVTGKTSLYRLSLEDSMVLYISEQNFMSPVSGEQYKMIIDQDSSDIKIESPILLEELRGMVKPLADNVAGFEFLNHYTEYADSINAIIAKGTDIKSKMRRNLQVTVKNAELKDNYGTYVGGSEYKAASDLKKFVDVINSSQSYSEIRETIEHARNAVGIFQQVYGDDLFANVDSINKDIKANLDEYNQILSDIRRLPRGIELFETESDQLNGIVSKIKQKTSSNNADDLLKMQKELEEALLFASEGKKETRYLVFEKSIENLGYVYKNEKSWEKEEE